MRNRIPSLLGAAFLAAGTLSAVLPAASASAADCAARNVSSYAADQGACGGTTDSPALNAFVVNESQFNQMFPNRNSFYSYGGLTAAMSAYPAFANTGSDTVKKQEAAAFLANVSHETGGLVYIVEQNTGNYPHYCDASQPYGCPAGQAAYYGRGPIQLSWNFNYKAAGDALGIDLLNNPYLVEQDSAVAWKTGLWYWMTQNGPGTMTGHTAMVDGHGFGETIRSINGSLECDGKNPGQVQSRVDAYQRFTQILGVPAGGNLTC
ncbi:chitinase [Actinomadura darangshiensis]|uniref:Chitinase n=1 Tax=Actinomadura darangshiensis TaxID=705336 RepID=A0A4R5BTF1_9ACTN|nr:chitinase [Actinomadura darangshiensis]TDD88916.1 chitinase [Actinomadura darangshiensis]